jgi:hypothetical protein
MEEVQVWSSTLKREGQLLIEVKQEIARVIEILRPVRGAGEGGRRRSRRIGGQQ